MDDRVTHWAEVLADHALLERAAAIDASDVSAVSALRRGHSAEQVAIALELVAARRKAVIKFGQRGQAMAADVQGIEQASGSAVAHYKAGRIREALGEAASIVDLCCGIGGDSIALAEAGLGVMSVDRDLLRVWMTRHNTAGSADAVCSDVASLELDGQALHLDPARRDESSGRRAWRIEDYQPGPEVIGRLLEQAPAMALKLSPGVDLEALPWPGEVEFISERGRLVQAVLWTGRFAKEDRRATLLADGAVHGLSGSPKSLPLGQAQRYLYTFDASVERADLVGLLCQAVDAPAVHPRLGLLTSGRVIESPWLTGFELIEQMSWRPKRVKQWLAAQGVGLVEVKTRDKACDPDREQKRLRGSGETTFTVFVLRFDTKVQALICRRLTHADPAGPGTASTGLSG